MADRSVTDGKYSQRKLRVVVVLIICLWIGIVGLNNLLKPVSNGCVMTYMYPTYIPIPMPENVAFKKYGLYLYHEGWRRIDFNDHIKKLSGVPVLFIPGNGGSFKQVRSLGAESDRAYHYGPLESNLFHTFTSFMVGVDTNLKMNISLPNKYKTMLDWFTVDLEGEHSALDGHIVQEHSEYVMYSIHRILDLYKESRDARRKEGASIVGSPPKSVILVGHSMGGFVARAAVMNPNLRKDAVETIVTLSTPHQSPPLAFQPSLARYYEHVNLKWREGYMPQISKTGKYISDPILSHVVVISISGGYNDYQVRTKLESLEGIVPQTHGFMISSMSMKNVWLSMEHQVILWCNQLVVQVSHTLLSLIDMETGQPIADADKRLGIFFKMLQNGISRSFITKWQPHRVQKTDNLSNNAQSNPGLKISDALKCPNNAEWTDDGQERDLYIQTKTFIILAKDGRRRWLDFEKLDPGRKSHFVFVTNLSPCSGVRLHLWPERNTSDSKPFSNRNAVDITSKLVPIPSEPSPRQAAKQSKPPVCCFLVGTSRYGWLQVPDNFSCSSGCFRWASTSGLNGNWTIFESKGGNRIFSPNLLFSEKDLNMEEGHPLAENIMFSVSIGLLPLSLSLTTTGCGIKKSDYVMEESGDMELNKLCKLRCFPPVALAWDGTSGLHVYPNLQSETLIVDSIPAFLTSSQETDETTVLILADPYCSYKATFGVSLGSATDIWPLLCSYLFALMRQTYAWNLNKPIPSVLFAIESNLGSARIFILLAVMPIALILLLSFLITHSWPPTSTFCVVSILCYIVANGIVVVLTLLSRLIFFATGSFHASIKKSWQLLEGNMCFACVRWFINFCYRFASIKITRILRMNTMVFSGVVSIALICLVHPALGLFTLLLSHASRCHGALSSHRTNEKLFASQTDSDNNVNESEGTVSPGSARSYNKTQLEIFHHQHGILILHLLAFFMLLPSLVARLQRIRTSKTLPPVEDSTLCIGLVLHGLIHTMPESGLVALRMQVIARWEVRLRLAFYLLSGYFCYGCALASAPYRVFYAMAAVGIVSFSCRIIETKRRNKMAETRHRSKRHSH